MAWNKCQALWASRSHESDCYYIVSKSIKGVNMGSKNIFWIFGILQSLSLGTIIFIVFKSLNMISDAQVIGLDAQISLSITFPLFLLIVEYIIYSKNWLKAVYLIKQLIRALLLWKSAWSWKEIDSQRSSKVSLH